MAPLEYDERPAKLPLFLIEGKLHPFRTSQKEAFMNSVNWDPSHDWDQYHDAMQERAEAEMWSEAIEETSFGQEALTICRRLKEIRRAAGISIDEERERITDRLIDLITGDSIPPEPEEPVHFNPAE